MSLADELIADLEGNESDDDEPVEEDQDPKDKEDAPAASNEPAVGSVTEVATLLKSQRLLSIMIEVEKRLGVPGSHVQPWNQLGPVESDPEYQLIVEANNLAVDVDNEIGIVHKFAREKYSKRFPELESLVVSPIEYVMSVMELGNQLEGAKNNEVLPHFLTQATIMVVSVTASTTQGKILSDEELSHVMEACSMALELNRLKLRIYEYVESRMAQVAPNLSEIVGSSTAAKLMGVAGGLIRLSRQPSCNIALLGAQKRVVTGFSHTATLPHTGFVYYCSIVQDTPPDLRRKAARLVASKCALAARVDAFHESDEGKAGVLLREEIERKLDKLQEPPPVKAIKPLPKPVDPSKKKRGGKRVRKMKERYAVTELRKAANRINFGDIEDDAYQADLGYSRGQLGKAGTGRVRMAQVDEKTKVRISRTLQKNLQKQNHHWGGATSVRRQTNVSGTASSVAFTPLQGLEIVNPQAAEKGTETTAKYFSTTAGFFQLNR